MPSSTFTLAVSMTDAGQCKKHDQDVCKDLNPQVVQSTTVTPLIEL